MSKENGRYKTGICIYNYAGRIAALACKWSQLYWIDFIDPDALQLLGVLRHLTYYPTASSERDAGELLEVRAEFTHLRQLAHKLDMIIECQVPFLQRFNF